MKMRKPCKGRLVNVVLKNAKFWNGKSFELQNEVRLNACENAETVEFDCNGALVMPALFGLGLDFMEPLRDDVYTFADGFDAMRKGGFYGGLYESAANPIDDADKYTAMVNRFKSEERGEEISDEDFKIYSKVVKALFQHRNKKARNALIDSRNQIGFKDKKELKSLIIDLEDNNEELKELLLKRTITLSPEEIMKIALLLKNDVK